MKQKWPIIAAVLLISALGIAVYANSIGGEFLLDDDLLIVDNPYVKTWVHVPKLFTEDQGKGAGLQTNYYRPLQMLTYMLDYHLWRMKVQPYHVTNILLHVLVALSLYWMVSILFNNRMLSLFTAVLFVVHPIHPESVAYISGRGDCMVALFMLLAFIFYVKQLGTGNFLVYVLLFASYLLALFSKEQSLMLPALFLLYHYAFRKRIKVYPFAALVVIALVYLVFRVSLLRDQAADMSLLAITQRVPGFFVAVAGYMRILFAPFDLHMGHEARLFWFTDPKAILGGIIIFSLLLYASKVREKNALVFFSIWWFFITLLPVSNLYPIVFYMADHYLYLPSIGFFLILANILSSLYKTETSRVYSVAVLAALTAAYSFLTVRQNTYWNNAKSFYERTLKYAPYNLIMYSHLAREYSLRGNEEKAIELYKKAIDLNPGFVNAYFNLGISYDILGKLDEALIYCKKAVEIDPRCTQAYTVMGTVYGKQGRYTDAITALGKAVEISPSNAVAISNLAIVYKLTGDRGKAIALFQEAIRINPHEIFCYLNLAQIYSEMGKKEQALELYKKVLEIDPTNQIALSNLK